MDPIYVTGHRNPDTDSIVAAISYAALRNACGDREYEAACLGRVSDETQIVLDRFGFLPPKRITDLYRIAYEGITTERFHPQPEIQCSWCQYRKECSGWCRQ